MYKKKILGALFCALSPLSYAVSDFSLDEIVVTATRIEQPLKQTLSSTTVITQEDIQNSQAADVPTILRSVAGVEIARNGGYGKSASLFLRGSNPNQVLVLLDGVRINSATFGTTSIEHLMLDQIDRIEVVRGNVSSLYGSEAIGGVVQIFTKQGHGEPVINLSAGVGSFGTRNISTGISGASADTSFSLQISKFITKGYSAINPVIALSANPDNDGYQNNSISANIKHAFTPAHSLSLSAFNSRGQSDFDSSAYSSLPTEINKSNNRISKLSLISDNHVSDLWQSTIQLAQGVDDSQNLTNDLPATPGSIYRTTNKQFNWQNNLKFSEDRQLLIGAESLSQLVYSDLQPKFDRDQRKVKSLYSGYTGKYGSHQVQINARHDDFSDFGNANTGLLGYGFQVNDELRIAGNTSTAFKAPTFNDLFYPFVDYGMGYSYQGNANLKPERSLNKEVGLHYFADAQGIDVVYFDNRIRDLITYNSLPAGTYINLDEARINGVEASYRGTFKDTQIKIAFTAQNPVNAKTGERLLVRAKYFSNIGIHQQLGSWKIGGEWQYSGERVVSDINTYTNITLDRYQLLNLTAQYQFNKQLTAAFRIDNLFDQNYMLIHGYNTQGRAFFATLSYHQ
jgi:vitamin B12 transporter